MKKLKFIEFLKEQDSNEVIYLGTKDGSGWIVIDTAETIINNMKKIEKIVRSRIVTKNKKAQNILDTFPSLIVKVQDELKESITDKEEIKKLENKLWRLESKYNSAFGTRKKLSKTLKSWKTIGNRIVEESYDHETDVIGKCVLLEGFDDGTLWFKGEKKVI